MRRLKHYSCFTLFALLTIAITSCNKDCEEPCTDPTNPKCENYDPCWDINEPTAKILMRSLNLRPGHGWSWTPYDTVFAYNVYFSSPFTGSEYEQTWYLGTEVIHAETFNRVHPNIERPQFITVSHVITYPVDSLCYPNTTGRDSTSATYYMVEYANEYAIRSKFRGAFANETDSFDFEFKMVYPDNSPVGIPSDPDTNVLSVGINFHNEGDSTEIVLGGSNLSGWFGGDGYLTPEGTLKIDSADRKTAVLEYRYLLEDFVVHARILE